MQKAEKKWKYEKNKNISFENIIVLLFFTSNALFLILDFEIRLVLEKKCIYILTEWKV